IRALIVTGVQTCALPIWAGDALEPLDQAVEGVTGPGGVGLGDEADACHASACTVRSMIPSRFAVVRPCIERCRKNSRLPLGPRRSEERRGGKVCGARGQA